MESMKTCFMALYLERWIVSNSGKYRPEDVVDIGALLKHCKENAKFGFSAQDWDEFELTITDMGSRIPNPKSWKNCKRAYYTMEIRQLLEWIKMFLIFGDAKECSVEFEKRPYCNLVKGLVKCLPELSSCQIDEYLEWLAEDDENKCPPSNYHMDIIKLIYGKVLEPSHDFMELMLPKISVCAMCEQADLCEYFRIRDKMNEDKHLLICQDCRKALYEEEQKLVQKDYENDLERYNTTMGDISKKRKSGFSDCRTVTKAQKKILEEVFDV